MPRRPCQCRHGDKDSLGRAHEVVEPIRAAPLCRRRPRLAADRRHVNEGDESAGRPRHAPPRVRANRRSCRDSSRHCARARRAPAASARPRTRRASGRGLRCAARPGAIAGRAGRKPPASGNSTDMRLRANLLDAQVPRARREAEQQHDVGRLAREQRRQLAVDGGVARREHVGDAACLGERGAAARASCSGDEPARIERRAGKAAEAGDQNASARSQAQRLRDLVDGERRRQPAVGDRALDLRQLGLELRVGREPAAQALRRTAPTSI